MFSYSVIILAFPITIIKRMSILLDHSVWKILVDTKRYIYFSWNSEQLDFIVSVERDLEQLDFIVNVEHDLDCMTNSMGFTDDLDFMMNTVN